MFRSIFGPGGKIGSISTDGKRDIAYDRSGKKLGEADNRGTRDSSGKTVVNEKQTGFLFGNRKK